VHSTAYSVQVRQTSDDLSLRHLSPLWWQKSHARETRCLSVCSGALGGILWCRRWSASIAHALRADEGAFPTTSTLHFVGAGGVGRCGINSTAVNLDCRGTRSNSQSEHLFAAITPERYGPTFPSSHHHSRVRVRIYDLIHREKRVDAVPPQTLIELQQPVVVDSSPSLRPVDYLFEDGTPPIPSP
jgi:hypothetical protein